MSAKKGFDHGGGAVAESNPHHLRRVAKEKATLMKIGVFRHDGEAVLGGYCQTSSSLAVLSPTSRTCVESG